MLACSECVSVSVSVHVLFVYLLACLFVCLFSCFCDIVCVCLSDCLRLSGSACLFVILPLSLSLSLCCVLLSLSLAPCLSLSLSSSLSLLFLSSLSLSLSVSFSLLLSLSLCLSLSLSLSFSGPLRVIFCLCVCPPIWSWEGVFPQQMSKEMELAGIIAPGSLKEARKLSKFFKYEPLKFVQALCNSLLQGSGFNLDSQLLRASPPSQPQLRDLESKGACVFLGDQEKKQPLTRTSFGMLAGPLCTCACLYIAKGQVRAFADLLLRPAWVFPT